MFGLDDVVEVVLGGTVWGLALVAGGAVAAVAGPKAKPLAKNVIKGCLAATDKVREFAAEATEQVQDLYAEAKYEYETQLTEAAAPVPAAATEAAPTRRGRTEEQPA